MKMLKKRLVIALNLALCVMLLSAPLALAETNTTEESIETTLDAETIEVSNPSADADVDINTEVTEDTEVNNESENTTENDTGEIPDSTENVEELPPVLDENGEVVSPGTLPDSPFYWLTLLIEKLQVILTVDPVEKTELLEEQALERIAEAGALIETGETEQAEVALKAYTEKVAEAQAFLALLSETDSETTQKLETALSKTHANNIQTLGGLLDKLPPQAAQKVALNIVRSMEKSIAKMDKKDQQKVAKELKKATKGIKEDSELTEEDQVALENLDQTLDLQDGVLEEEVAIAATSGVTLNSMALTTNSTAYAAKTTENSRQYLVQNAKGNVTKPKLEVKEELELTKQHEQKQESKGEDITEPKDEPKGEPEDKSKDEAKALELKQQEAKLKAEQERALKEKDQSSSNSVKKQDEEKTQQKAPKESEKGDKSGGKER